MSYHITDDLEEEDGGYEEDWDDDKEEENDHQSIIDPMFKTLSGYLKMPEVNILFLKN